MKVATAARRHGAGIAGTGAPWAVAAMVAALFMGSTLVTPLYRAYGQVFGFAEITLTLIYAVYAVGNLAALLFLGRLSDEIGRKPVSLAALGLAGASTVLYLLAFATAWLFWARLLSGFAIGLASGTGAAWLAELDADRNKAGATLLASGANFAGLAVGPLLSGILAQVAPWPLRLSYLVYFAILIGVAVLVARGRETMQKPAGSWRRVSLQPRIGVPPPVRFAFIAPAVGAFGTFALIGFYAALIPSVLAGALHETSRAVGGAVVFELFLASTVAVIATRNLSSRRAMVGGLVLLLPSLLLLVLAQATASLGLLLAATLVSGVAGALGYRGSLQVVNRIAPSEQRAELVSSYYVVTFLGNSLPVIGVGILTTLASALTASIAFAVTIGAFALAALAAAWRYTPSAAA